MSIKLKELIIKVRACKTAAEERAVISKECALIRTSFKDGNDAVSQYYRPRNVLKLIFIHLLSVNNNNKYPSVAHFGQMESIKLIAKQLYYQKRVGYLALSILVRNDTSLLTLVTNSISLDLQKMETRGSFKNIGGIGKYDENELCVAMALNTLANISNKEMILNLSKLIYTVLKSEKPMLQKKAILCVLKVMKKDPDLIEDFIDRLIAVFKDKCSKTSNIAALMNSYTVFNYILRFYQSEQAQGGSEGSAIVIGKLQKEVVPLSVKLFTKLNGSKIHGDSDMHSVTEPFLQVKVLQFFGEMGAIRLSTVSEFSEVMVRVLSNTTGKKNIGNAVRYECVKGILTIVLHHVGKGEALSPAVQKLEKKALEVLVDLLSTDGEEKDLSSATCRNLKFISLFNINSLVQSHPSRYVPIFEAYQQQFMDCLKDDDDPSIVRASLTVIFSMISENNFKPFVAEVLTYLQGSSTSKEHKEFIAAKLGHFLKYELAGKEHSQHRLLVALQLLAICSEFVPEYLYMFFVNLALSQESDSFSTELILFLLVLVNEATQVATISSCSSLLKALLYLVGEKYALLEQSLTRGTSGREVCSPGSVNLERLLRLGVHDLTVDLPLLCGIFERVAYSPEAPEDVVVVAMNALTKLCVKLNPSDPVYDTLKRILGGYTRSLNIEYQTRGCEYINSLNQSGSKDACFKEPIYVPPLSNFLVNYEIKATRETAYNMLSDDLEESKEDLLGFGSSTSPSGSPKGGVTQDSLLGTDMFADLEPEKEASTDPMDLLQYTETTAAEKTAEVASDPFASFDDLLQTGAKSPQTVLATASAVERPSITETTKHGIKVDVVNLKSSTADVAQFKFDFSNTQDVDLDQVEVEVAVPKSYTAHVRNTTESAKLGKHGASKIQKNIEVHRTTGSFQKLGFKLRLKYSKGTTMEDDFGFGFGTASEAEEVVEELVIRDLSMLKL